jgi:N-acetylglucosaminyldiphosphoundecaprenol N-acetyl-beta-D-mannosaminyltransferase
MLWQPIFQPMHKRRTILSVPVDTQNPEEFVDAIIRALKGSELKTVLAINAEKVMHARKDPELFKALESSDLLLPDGIGAVVGVRLKYGEKIRRTTGVGMMRTILARAEDGGHRVFLFGAKPETNREASEKVVELHPGINLVGTENGYIGEEQYASLVERINSLQTEILFVALGSPKQEKWIFQHRKDLAVKVCMGVGGSFDVLAGKVALAPRWTQRAGLEWLYRLLKEPRRYKRQLVLPRFMVAIIRDKIFSREKNK